MKRIDEFMKVLKRRRLEGAVVFGEANVRALTGVKSDNVCLRLDLLRKPLLYTDFRYAPMVRRVAPGLAVRDLKKLEADLRARKPGRLGYESSVSQSRFASLRKACRKTVFVDVAKDLLLLRAVKTPEEIARLREAEALTCAIWKETSRRFAAGMTEREMARMIRHEMIERADGESFETIVCIGKNAAECHHEPDDTVWDGRAPVLVDMGVKLGGYCADLTRNLLPTRASRAYRQVYALVREANAAAIAAAKPGMTSGALDAVARRVIRKGGFGRCFGHSLGHGVGLEIHEYPTARKGEKTVLRPGMLVTVEPGVYLEENLGVRIEDLVLITETGCEVLSAAAAK